MKKLWNKLKIYLKPFCSWKFLISFGSAWLVTNGWCYIFIVLGPILEWHWMTAVGSAYAAFLYFPFTVEKLVTIPLAIFIHTMLFRNDTKTRQQLDTMYDEAKADWNKIKNKFKRRKK